jgi:hypothetical protein
VAQSIPSNKGKDGTPPDVCFSRLYREDSAMISTLIECDHCPTTLTLTGWTGEPWNAKIRAEGHGWGDSDDGMLCPGCLHARAPHLAGV